MKRSFKRAVVAGVCVATALALSPAASSQADDSHTLTIVGTSDVFDSNLVQSVLKPGFEATHPGVTLNYVSKGTGAAIQFAEQGLASGLLVHAASLENQFVDQGYSAEQYGRALFYGDYVLLGSANDATSANVAATASHNIVSAYQKIAAAGAQGKANFVSRGGTPGTTVQEHAIWALVPGVTKCDVSDVNGGGQSPSTVTGPCPATIPFPAWYHATGQTQGPNIQTGDVCNFTGGGCYVFTDRGTFNYLASTGAIQANNLRIVTRDNAANAPGGNTLLVNSFHAYAINPAKFPGVALNTSGMIDFLNWVTSPPAQAAVAGFLSQQTNGDPPFIPDAAPLITGSVTPSSVAPLKPLVIKGTIANLVPGTPKLSGVTVTLNQKIGNAAPVAVMTAVTTASGAYTFRYKPTSSGTYSVSTAQISKVEIPTLSPIFGDLLAPASATVGSANVLSTISISSVKAKNGVLTIKAAVNPATLATSNIQLFANHTNLVASQGLLLQGQVSPPVGTKTPTVTFTLPRGFNWTIQLVYNDTDNFVSSQSPTKAVAVN